MHINGIKGEARVSKAKLDGVAPLVADPPRWNSAFRQNLPIWDISLYIALTCNQSRNF